MQGDALQAEKDVLGAVLLDNSVLSIVSGILQTSDFFAQPHRVIFDAMRATDAKNEPIDLATISTALIGNKVFEDAGGVQYLITITNTLPSAQAVKTYCRLVKERALLRRIGDALACTSAELNDSKKQTSAVECAQTLKDKLDEITQEQCDKHWTTLEDSARDALTELEAISSGELKGVKTGFIDLDKMLAGLREGSVTIIAARPGMGKTAFALNIVRSVSVQNKTPCAVFSLEMTAKELAMRIISSIAQVDSNAMRNGNLTEKQWAALFGSAREYKGAPIYIDETPAISITTLRDRAKQLKQEKNIQLIVVDYLQLMTSGARNINSREQEVADISRGLKLIAKELHVPVICLSQLNRGNESRTDKRPFLSDLRESGSIEQDADNILFIHREDYYSRERKTNKAEIIIAKQRSGSTGSVELLWDGSTTSFKNLQSIQYFDDV